MLESKIQKNVVTWLRQIGCKVIILKVASVSGHADLIICYKGLYIEFEMKQPDKHATKLQLIKRDETLNADGYWFEIHSIEEAVEAITIVDKLKGI